MLFGYARVSKGEEQSTALQIQALRAAGVERIFEDSGSGSRWDRPQLQKMLELLREGDVIVVWKLDRISRSLLDLARFADQIKKLNASFQSLTESIDTSTPSGRMLFGVLATFAEYERDLIRARTNAGLSAARAEGRIGGRPKALTPAQRADIVENVLSERKTAAEMARLYGVSAATISRVMAEARAKRLNSNKQKCLNKSQRNLQAE
jgi:DNA invertase Pin-like site-specific DNA recombinase